MDTDSLSSPLDNPSIASGTTDSQLQRSSDETDSRVYQKNVYDPPYFPPLNPEDEFDIFDIELCIDASSKTSQADVVVRYRNASSTSSGRPAYKVEKILKAHLLGKKNLNIQVLKSQTWDSAKGEPIAGKPKGNTPIWEGFDQTTRQMSVTATKHTVLKSTTYAGAFSLTPYCGHYDPQRPRPVQHRDCLSHHFIPMPITDFEVRGSPRGKQQPPRKPEALTKPYSGGGHLLFDCHSQGRKELLTTLYCTGYDRRHRVRKGDIVLAELRMPHVAGTDRAERPTWLRFFKERHATLYISRRGMDAAFTGLHVNMAVPNAVEGNRYTLTRGQSQELVITTFAMMLLSIEHDGIESKKWNWMLERGVLERHTRHFSDSLAVTVKEDPEQASLIETSSVIKSPGSISPKHVHSLKPGEVMENWKVSSFSSSIKNNIGDAMLRSTTDSPISESIADEPNTPIDEHQGPYGQGSNFPVFHSQANSAYSSQEQNEHVIGEEVVDPQSNFYIKEKGQFHPTPEPQIAPAVPSMIAQPQPYHQTPYPAQTPPPPPQQVFAGELQYPGQPPYPPMNGQEQPRPTPHMSIQGPPLSHPVAQRAMSQISYKPQRPITPQRTQTPPVQQHGGTLLYPKPLPVHPASLTSWAEDTRPEHDLNTQNPSRKEGPKVTGRPKPGEDGGIYW